MIWFRLSSVVALAAVVVGAAALPAALSGAAPTLVWRPGGIALGIRLDVLSVMLMIFVGVLGWVVSRYSATNLRGRDRPHRAGLALVAAVASLLLTVTGESLVVVALGWTLSGMAVAGLVARAGTPQARAATRVVRRTLMVGDLLLWGGVVVGVLTLPSLERARLVEVEPGWGATLTATLLLGACVARTGLVPAHRWLPETTEAPSPVSALLHAGVVNGAGVLVLLFWPLFTASPLVLLALLVLGAASVVMGTWASRVRADVKGRLACSTTSQMGYMCIQLGLGLPVAALLHLMGHGAYKSWLFLRAGGAVGRARAATPPGEASPMLRRAAALLAASLSVVLGVPATLHLVAALGSVALLPVVLAACVAALAGYASSGLRRVGPGMVWGVVTAAGILGAAYTWLLLVVEQSLAGLWPPVPLWAPIPGTALALSVVVVGVVAHRGYLHLDAHPTSALSVWLLPTSLTPTHPRVRHLAFMGEADASSPAALTDPDVVASTVRLASAVVGPAWPLRNFVATSTLARLETMSFGDALLVAEQVHGVSPRPTLRYYLDLFDARTITVDHVRAALDEERPHVQGGGSARLVDDFLEKTHDLAVISATSRDPLSLGGSRHFVRLCESLAPADATRVTDLVDTHAALWTQRAWASTGTLYATGQPPSTPGPWEMWREAASRTGYDRAVGITGASALVRSLPPEPAAAIGVLASLLGLSAEHLMTYMVATFASAPGWSGHAAWRADRTGETAPLVELAALRMAHDALFSRATIGLRESSTEGTEAWPEGVGYRDGRDVATLTFQTRVWQRALEIGIEEWLITDIAVRDMEAQSRATSDDIDQRPTSQSVWCIDVRSERVRRELEALGGHRTHGFAGFFGAAVEHIDQDGIVHELCPALIRPTFTARERPTRLTMRQSLHRTLTDVSQDPVGALLVAEAGGVVAALASTASTLSPRAMRGVLRAWTDAPAARSPRTGPGAVSGRRRPVLDSDLDIAGRVAMASAALRSMGLTGNFAPVVVICGHTASPENNAFATAYDCGACGGNHGVVNAIVLADALNEPQVRSALAAQDIVIPADTVAVAAVHDTTTDMIELLVADDTPHAVARTLASVAEDLQAAGANAARSRRAQLPSRGAMADARPLTRRAADWSEPTPEWGLADNAAIVFGPRALTTDSDLQGRVFLHSYDRDGDPDGAILEQLLTAPLVVAQWINAQYYFSAVAPTVLGAGDKTTHNVIGDVGVIRGAHGDLRTGLPWQALFRAEPGTRPDATNLVHTPVRLLGIVVADCDKVRDIVSRNAGLAQLVCNEWVHMVCVDRGSARRLLPNLTWQPW